MTGLEKNKKQAAGKKKTESGDEAAYPGQTKYFCYF